MKDLSPRFIRERFEEFGDASYFEERASQGFRVSGAGYAILTAQILAHISIPPYYVNKD
jgi:hypothetical protein